MSIIAPPSIGVDKAAALIHKTLAEINSEAMYGLHGRSQHIETQVVKSGQTIEQLEAQVTSSNEKLKELHHSCMLFLSGRTAIEGRQYKQWTHSWLSPAAIYITEDLTHEDAHVAFFSCHPGMESKVVPIKQIISSITLQILKLQPQILRDNAVQFHSATQTELFKNLGTAKKQVKAIVRFLGDVLAAVKQFGPMYIVLDRLDQYDGKFSVLMDELVRLVASPTCNVKFVVIADTSIGGGEWHPEYLPEEDFRLDRIFIRQDLNQTKLTSLELSKGDRPLTWISGRSTATLGDAAA